MNWRFLIGLIAIGCLSLPIQAADEFDHGIWDGLTKKYVIPVPSSQSSQVYETRVNYEELSKEQDNLGSYLAKASHVTSDQFDAWPKTDQLAFLINIYNAATVQLVLGNYKKIESIKDLGSLFKSPWKKSFISLFGKTISLDDIEQGYIRGSNLYHEPRIHFAVNCASIGCPALRNEAYVGARLDAQLEAQARGFIGDSSRNRIENNTLRLSSIFKWYHEDFEMGWRGAARLEDFLLIYADDLSLSQVQREALKKGNFEISYLPYDWKLNRTQP